MTTNRGRKILALVTPSDDEGPTTSTDKKSKYYYFLLNIIKCFGMLIKVSIFLFSDDTVQRSRTNSTSSSSSSSSSSSDSTTSSSSSSFSEGIYDLLITTIITIANIYFYFQIVTTL